MTLPKSHDDQINAAIEQACKDLNLQCTSFFLDKVRQAYEIMNIRHGLMLVGGSMSGKTSAYKTLAAALAILHNKV